MRRRLPVCKFARVKRCSECRFVGDLYSRALLRRRWRFGDQRRQGCVRGLRGGCDRTDRSGNVSDGFGGGRDGAREGGGAGGDFDRLQSGWRRRLDERRQETQGDGGGRGSQVLLHRRWSLIGTLGSGRKLESGSGWKGRRGRRDASWGRWSEEAYGSLSFCTIKGKREPSLDILLRKRDERKV